MRAKAVSYTHLTGLKWCDYAYTVEGDLLASYGQEDLCWTNNAAGNPEFTEYMYNNPDDLSLAEAYHYYAKLGGAGSYHWDREFAGMPQSDLDAMTTWKTDNDAAYEMCIRDSNYRTTYYFLRTSP